MKRSETKLIVENWRKVLDKGLHEEEVFLNEGAIKNALLALAFSVPAFFSSGDVSAKVSTNDILSQPGIESVYDNKSNFDNITVKKAKKSINDAGEIIAFANNKETKDIEELLLSKYDNYIEKTKDDPGFTLTRASEDFFKDLNGYINKCIKKINKKSKTSEDKTGSRLDPDQQEKVDNLAKLIDAWTKRSN
tara:strand:- start:766 stop:1341 length:576 start_codon:yes stop_codon:yes gene_type:complete